MGYDSEFRQQLATGLDRIIELTSGQLDGSLLPPYQRSAKPWGEPEINYGGWFETVFEVLTTPIDGGERTVEWIRFQPPVERWRALFRPFTDASYDAAERAALELKSDVQRVLNDNAIDDSSGPVRVIHAVLEDWDGPPGSVAYKFKFDYLANLQKALRYQLEFAQALELILDARAALIRFSCEQVLGIANKTVALLEQADADQRQAAQEATLTIVDKIVGYAEAAEGGPVKVATVALKELTESFREQLADPAGETPWEITESMERAVSELHKLVTNKGQIITDAMAALQEFLAPDSRKHADILPADVNLAR